MVNPYLLCHNVDEPTHQFIDANHQFLLRWFGIEGFMSMEIDTDKIRLLRKKRCWSQEQVAEKAGIGLRTVQRMETRGIASKKSTLCLANLYGVDVIDLLADENWHSQKTFEKQGVTTLSELELSFRIHAICYSIGCFCMLLVDLVHNPTQWWWGLPAAFWAIGLFTHGASIHLVEFIEKMENAIQKTELDPY